MSFTSGNRSTIQIESTDDRPITVEVKQENSSTRSADQNLIYGSTDSDLIYGGAADESIWGFDGVDTIDGGAGNDVINGGLGIEVDYLFGAGGNDFIGGGGGADHIYGQDGNDEIRAGQGKDIVSGGGGSDVLYGGGGANTYLSEADGDLDQLFIVSDLRSHGFDWGRSHGGINADVITELDQNDRITILGTSDSSLTYRQVAAGTYNQTQAGIGIFDGETLEALYIGNNLSLSQLDAITTADPSRFY